MYSSQKSNLFAFLLAFFIFVFLFLVCDKSIITAQATYLEQNHKHYYRTGSTMNIDKILGLDTIQGKSLLHVVIKYNMIRSNLRADWMYNNQVIGHTDLTKGLSKEVKYTFNKPLPGSVQVRFTGQKGQIQIRKVRAYLKHTVQNQYLQKLSSLKPLQKFPKTNSPVKLDSIFMSQKDMNVAKKVKERLTTSQVIEWNIKKDDLRVSANNGTVFLSGKIKNVKPKELRQSILSIPGVKNVNMSNLEIISGKFHKYNSLAQGSASDLSPHINDFGNNEDQIYGTCDLNIVGSNFSKNSLVFLRKEDKLYQAVVTEVVKNNFIKACLPRLPEGGHFSLVVRTLQGETSKPIYLVRKRPDVMVIRPTIVTPGDKLQIIGRFFYSDAELSPEKYRVIFNGTTAAIPKSFGPDSGNTDMMDTLEVIVPQGAMTGPVTISGQGRCGSSTSGSQYAQILIVKE